METSQTQTPTRRQTARSASSQPNHRQNFVAGDGDDSVTLTLSDDNDNNQFLNLPAFVTDRILDYLQHNTKDLKNLRLVCRTTKSWVEVPKHLQKLPLYVKTESRLNGLLSCDPKQRIGWTHAAILIQLLGNPSIAEFIKAYTPSLESVKVVREESTNTEVQYLNGEPEDTFTLGLINNVLCQLGPGVRSLCIHGEFRCFTQTYYDSTASVVKSEIAAAKANLSERVGQLPNVRILEFVIAEDEYRRTNATELNWFVQALLKMCPNLTTLKLPLTGWDPGTLRFPTTLGVREEFIEESQRDFRQQLNPLISYLKNMATRPGVASVELSFGNEKTFTTCIQINHETLLELAEACSPIGGRLLYVPYNSLLSNNKTKLLTAQQLASLNSAVASVVMVWESIVSRSLPLYVPPEATIFVLCEQQPDSYTNGNAFEQRLATFQLNRGLNITSMTLHKSSGWYYSGHPPSQSSENLVHQFFETVRPTVEHLKLAWDRNYPHPHVSSQDFRHCFPNLKTVSLTRLRIFPNDRTDYAAQVLSRLPVTVEQIEVSWSRVGDACFVGGQDYPPMHVRLPKLTHLALRNCNLEELTNTSFESTFKHMNLKVFCFIPAKRECEVTFQEGISLLITEGALMKDSLEVFDCFIPEDSSAEEMTQHLEARFSRLSSCSLWNWSPGQKGRWSLKLV